MRIQILSPLKSTHFSGNQVTADRWRLILEKLGHDVFHSSNENVSHCDLLIVLNAYKCHTQIVTFKNRFPNVPLFVALTGTDIYFYSPSDPKTQRSIELADKLILLQPLAAQRLPSKLKEKSTVIYQSIEKKGFPTVQSHSSYFDVLVVAHLRKIKAPLLCAQAARSLPKPSKIRITLIGKGLDDLLASQVEEEAKSNPRFRWLGELSHDETTKQLYKAELLVNSSELEGGANIVSESIVAGTPVLATAIEGNRGLLGENYPGLFPKHDSEALCKLMQRCEQDKEFLCQLNEIVNSLSHLFERKREIASWKSLLENLAPHVNGH